MTENYFTPRMKMADIISNNYFLILMLPRLGIPLGFGEKSVRDVCQAHNVPVEFMLLISNVYTFDNYQPSEEELAAADMRLLVPYLQASHNYYTGERLPHIEAHLHHIADRIEPRYGSVLKNFFADFRHEISDHFRIEEEYHFPKLLQLQQGLRPPRRRIAHPEEAHGGIVDKLSDLTQIVYKYLPGNVLPEETMELVFDILELSADIQKHAMVEDKILIPYMKWLERSKA